MCESADRSEIVRYLDNLLRIANFKDFCTNGLQVEGCREVSRVGFAVDASLATFEGLEDCQMIIVHHGMMWPSWDKVTEANKLRMKFLMDHDISLYVSHLPLDRHPQYGNNAQILKTLGFDNIEEFGEVGWCTHFNKPMPRAEFIKLLQGIWGDKIFTLPYGSEEISSFGVCSGGGGQDYLREAVKMGLDFYVTGETAYPFYHDSLELGINVACCGHYATETFGVKALMPVINEAFGLDTWFFDCPTGL